MKHKTPLPNTAHAHRVVAHTTTTSMPRIFGMSDAEAMLAKYTSWRDEAVAAQLDATFYDDCVAFYAARVQREKAVTA